MRYVCRYKFCLKRRILLGSTCIAIFYSICIYAPNEVSKALLMYADMCLAQPDCAEGELKCVAGSGGCCISSDKICDGYLDCEDNVDEKNCPTDTHRQGE